MVCLSLGGGGGGGGQPQKLAVSICKKLLIFTLECDSLIVITNFSYLYCEVAEKCIFMHFLSNCDLNLGSTPYFSVQVWTLEREHHSEL